MLVMNRDLTAAQVPTVRASDLEPFESHVGGSGHRAGWARIWHFARTFDVAAYSEGTGTPLDGDDALRRVREAASSPTLRTLHLRDLRAALVTLYWLNGHGTNINDSEARLIDAILDAAYARVSGGQVRPDGGPGLYEPQLGIFGASYGEGQHRFWFEARESGWTREELFDRAAGLLLREISPDVILSALFLYPPDYSDEDPAEPPTHTFMILLQPRPTGGETRTVEVGDEYNRLTRLVGAALSAPGTAFPASVA